MALRSSNEGKGLNSWGIHFICMLELGNSRCSILWSKSCRRRSEIHWAAKLFEGWQTINIFHGYFHSYFTADPALWSLWIAPDFWWERPEMSLGECFVPVLWHVAIWCTECVGRVLHMSAEILGSSGVDSCNAFHLGKILASFKSRYYFKDPSQVLKSFGAHDYIKMI